MLLTHMAKEDTSLAIQDNALGKLGLYTLIEIVFADSGGTACDLKKSCCDRCIGDDINVTVHDPALSGILSFQW